MDFEKFYDIAEYGNKNWKGKLSPKESAMITYDYLTSYENLKSEMEYNTDTVIFGLLDRLLEDRSEEAIDYAREIVSSLCN